MQRTIKFSHLLAAAVLVVFMLLPGTAPAQSGRKLTGKDVASIVSRFLHSHYSRTSFDDAHSALMLKGFINRFDPGHYYFLQRDIDEFQAYSRRLDNMVPAGNIKPAFAVFERARKRINERASTISRLLKGKFDLKSEDSTVRDRKNEPYPKNEVEADKLWAKKLKFELLEQVLGGTGDAEARKNLERRYRSRRILLNRFTHNDVVRAFLKAFTAAYDPHSDYLTPDDLENFNIALRLSLEGIGATLRWEDGMTVVTSIIAGGAAWREGSLKKEDKIAAVAQGAEAEFEDVQNMRLIDVVKRIRGPRGTIVRLAILRKLDSPVETRHEIKIERDKIILKEGEAKGKIRELPRKGGPPFKFGVITLPSFYVDFAGRQSNPDNYKSSAREVAKILEDFKAKGVDGVVLDLRDNGGGGLDEAISLSGLLLKKDVPVVMVKNFRGRITKYPNPHDKPVYKGPLVVITNRYSASASEILAGALQDYGRALLVGDRATFGKGTVQNIIQLSRELGALKSTVAKFYRPGSTSTQNKGVVPDIVLPSLNNHLDMGESSLDNALPWDSVRKSAFQPWGDLAPYIPVIQERSRQRRRAQPEFIKIEERVAKYLKIKNRKVVTVSRMIESSKKGGKPERPTPRRSITDNADKKDKKDFYLDEVVQIMVDYVHLSQNKPLKQVVIRKE